MYEKFVARYGKEITIREERLPTKLSGLFLDNVIYINSLLSEQEKTSTLIEEVMHAKYTVGNITEQTDISHRKQEMFARKRSYEFLIPLDDIIACYYAGFHEYFEVAEHLGVTEEFLKKTVDHYKNKFGTKCSHRDYSITFGNTIRVQQNKACKK
ncbi:Domain of uncharacterised function (DUF955) [Listeria grayi]|uniref:Toxin-antitoxin system, toxin component n=2 Tax=Listeria grayi TaxID=1641 RepID=D7UUW2_LISGR|nr:ImmA/IrrE family metallo-endopeptidase [Listeria grayi]EFI85038.1 putative toxin-antitoxin system, toxin component [Listeria grayi DSM 20601]EUJ28571.1 bacteriophage gp35-type protein [Listeria grayi FSL F6-1183]MBC1922012.1 ImmA/IrrE family metallo-endopeptidase [Listeria grayi]VEI30428.1 Domain of uncharacterised function (DUF955) [Listeria grayi]